ncbi:RagB/SusD family nutrient uptake outer membrane protein [Plebeiibacterium sediminum]|uniref:RagB/SusD family nutrient uptake outer membrane protein n=1 Tax=Plebeiibacterium sediminum TaxID=2992112 RepID=A0AAE3SDT6_9BACT|nr:RagB/SusD family nutrient uptake outer membrane protein [Plebeiobacterium sediminum]MCW3785773.1 RagB/SusD family nutrient uptake outer membrane protein [Plebeiobacterium sediminum]
MKNIQFIFLASLAVLFSSCETWLTETAPAVTGLEDYYTSGETGIYTTNAAYVPLTWEYNYTYYSDFFIGDVMSDDALKGGQNTSDMADVYDMENFKTIANNGYLLDFYRTQYMGIGRCNLGLREVPALIPNENMTAEVQQRLLGELKFLRAMYYFRLVRVFGGVPLVDYVIESTTDWQQPRATVESVYNFIVSDLEDASELLWEKSAYAPEELGRATKGAAQAMLLKVNLYIHDYTEAKRWGEAIISSNEYDLLPTYANNFSIDYENGLESVFEVQYADDPTGDYGGSNGEGGSGYTRGTYSIILTRSRSSLLGGGWGFNKPTVNLYNEYESNDPRRDATILNPTDDQIENPEQEIYLGTRFLNKKTGFYDADGNPIELSHPSRGPLNRIDIRFADVLLMYAEACCETGDYTDAKNALERVRNRARQGQPDILPAFPDYNGYADNKADLVSAVRHERRVELGMEGHRWYDLCRWGVAKQVMDAYKATESPEAQSHMAEFIAGKHELFPIPSKEIELNPMEQNPMY